MIKIIQAAVFSTKTVLVHMFQFHETKTSNINKQSTTTIIDEQWASFIDVNPNLAFAAKRQRRK